MEHVNDNKPLRELAFALIGILLFVAMVALIAISAWLRPAGEHYAPEAVAETEVTEPTNPTNRADVPNVEPTVTEPVIVEEQTSDTAQTAPDDASTTPAMLAQEGTATAEGTVNQAGAELVDANAPAELTDGDVVADTDVVNTDTAEVANAMDVVEADVVEVEAVDTADATTVVTE